MAVEDGAALGVLLSKITSKDEISERLSLFQQLRIDRVSAMVIFSSVGQDESARIAEMAKPYVRGPIPSKSGFSSIGRAASYFEADLLLAATPEEYHIHNFTPNVIRDAMELLENH